MRFTRGPRALLALLVCTALFAAACSDDGGDATGETDGPDEAPQETSTTTTQAPVSGGVVTFGAFVPLGGFDPIGAARGVYGCCGGVELSAIYAGGVPATQLAAAGRVRGDDAAVSALSRAFLTSPSALLGIWY